MPRSTLCRAIVCTVAAVLASGPADAFGLLQNRSVVTIRNDSGGYVLEYALRMKKMDRAGQKVQFAGRCDSACTLFLALPAERTCVDHGASFGFHLPYGSSAKVNQIVKGYMLNSYPAWVQAWLRDEGGLTGSMKRMDYEYASLHLPPCAPVKARYMEPVEHVFR